MDFEKIINEQVGHNHCADAMAWEEYNGKIVAVDYVVGGVAVTYENGKRFEFFRVENQF
jgi:hypothetical protein